MEAGKTRNQSIDVAKGILILLVIAGHTLQGGITDTLPRYMIYAFHMPLFIAVSGYLLDPRRLLSLSFFQLVKKYFFRLVIPWVCAVCFYGVFNLLVSGEKPTLRRFVLLFLRPYYHLWFVVGFLAYIFLTWFGMKLLLRLFGSLSKASAAWLLFCLIVSVVSRIRSVYVPDASADVVQYDFRFFFLAFFAFGMLLRVTGFPHKRKVLPLWLFGTVACVSSVAEILLFYFPSALWSVVFFFLLNFSLLYLLLYACARNALPKCRFLSFVGMHSYAFYLWHVVVILLLLRFPGAGDLPLFYLSALLAFSLFAGVIALLLKSRFCRTFLFGEPDKK